jgi:hypothetical protein
MQCLDRKPRTRSGIPRNIAVAPRSALVLDWCRAVPRTLPGTTHVRVRWRSSAVEHPICNRAVVGSIPTASFRQTLRDTSCTSPITFEAVSNDYDRLASAQRSLRRIVGHVSIREHGVKDDTKKLTRLMTGLCVSHVGEAEHRLRTASAYVTFETHAGVAQSG